MDKVYVVVELYEDRESIVGASAVEDTARTIAASGDPGHGRYIEIYENGVKVAEFGWRE